MRTLLLFNNGVKFHQACKGAIIFFFTVKCPIFQWKRCNIGNKFKNIGISLSGGVDSMVLLYYLVMNNYNVVAIHIEYCNREEAKEEREFL